jgi:hypothetical protein
MSAASFNDALHFFAFLPNIIIVLNTHCSFYLVLPQAIPLDMYVFYTNTHIKHWDLRPNHNCVIICFLVLQPDNNHIWPKHVANLN